MAPAFTPQSLESVATEASQSAQEAVKTNGDSKHAAILRDRDPDNFLRRTVQDLFSLAQRTIVITGGARGIGLAFAFAVAEAGGNVAILDITEDPHPHYHELVRRFPDQTFLKYKLVRKTWQISTKGHADGKIQNRCNQIRRPSGFHRPDRGRLWAN